MTTNAISTTTRTSHPMALAHATAARPSFSLTSALASRMRAAWDGLAASGQLGPDREADIGRATGARI